MTDLPRALLETAEALARRGYRRPAQSDLRRAVSTAYYALFHGLAGEVADLLIGATRRGRPAWGRIYRALDHKFCKDRLEAFAREPQTGPQMRLFCSTFGQIQGERHRADYDPGARFRREEALGSVGRARDALAAFRRTSREERLELATRVLFRDRP